MKGVRISSKDGRRVVEGLGFYKPGKINNLRELVKESAAKYGDMPGFRFKDKQGMITGKTYKEFDREIDCLGTALLSLGLKDARISVISENRYEWGVCYFSIVNGTGIAVPLDKYLPKNEVENLVERANVEAMFYSSAFHDMMVEISEANDKIKYFICMEGLDAYSKKNSKFLAMPDLILRGSELLKAGDNSFTEAPIDEKKMSILLFTSGTTSMAKGVMLSHHNIASNINAVSTIIELRPGDVHLSLLPLHHTFESTIGLMYMVHRGVCIAYSDGIKHVARNLQEYNVSVLVAVPAIFEAMYRRIQEGIEKSGKAGVVRMLIKVSNMLRAVGIDLRRKFFRSIFEKAGPNLRLAVSGAAPLDPEVVIGFDNLGLTLLQGYGLTETSPVVSCNTEYKNKTGTVGVPLAGIEVAIDSPDENGMGELIVKGENVMLGYYEDPRATADAIDREGWFRTGDLAVIDEEGFIKITGRAKSMIVFDNGKKAFPEEYEVLLNNIPGVKDSFVWGNRATDGDVQICAKLVVDREKLAEEKGGMPSDQELAARFNAAIKEINSTIPQYKIIRYFVMSDEELIKTTTLKIKRPLEYEKIRSMLDKAGLEMRKASGSFIEKL